MKFGGLNMLNTLKNLVDRPVLDKKCCFIHVPKCGGTSIVNAIRDSYKIFRSPNRQIGFHLDENAARVAQQLTDGSYDRTRRELLCYAMSLPSVRCVTGHFTLSERAFAEYYDSWKFVTILRKPVSRWISHYKYLAATGRLSSDISSMKDFLDSSHGRVYGRLYVSFFASEDLERNGLESAVDVAVKRLKEFSIVGALEDLEAFNDAYRMQMGRGLRIPYLNRNVESQYTDEEREHLEEIEKVCEPDIAIYNSVFDPGRVA